jgi:hypothetical protein
VKSWPPQQEFENEITSQQQHPISPSCLLSPGTGDYRSARSPTPSKEALEMDKLWSRPMRFSSPTKFENSPITSPPMSPRPAAFHSPTPPRVPPKPQKWSSQSAERGYTTPTELTSTIPPQTFKNQIQSGVAGPKSPREPLYYVSVVSTPTTTPIPPPFSPTPEREMDPPLLFSEARNFQEKKEFFEQRSSSYSEMEKTSLSSYQHTQSSSSSSFMKQSKPMGEFSLLDSSFLPPPGEAPEYLFAPPPPVRYHFRIFY